MSSDYFRNNLAPSLIVLISLIILVIINLNILGETSGTLIAADDNLSAENNTLPLGGLFSSSGVLGLILMAVILIFLLKKIFNINKFF